MRLRVDFVYTLYDDFTELAGQAEYYDWCGMHGFDLDRPDEFGEWAAAMAPCFEAIRLLDALIHVTCPRFPYHWLGTFPRG